MDAKQSELLRKMSRHGLTGINFKALSNTLLNDMKGWKIAKKSKEVPVNYFRWPSGPNSIRPITTALANTVLSPQVSDMNSVDSGKAEGYVFVSVFKGKEYQEELPLLIQAVTDLKLKGYHLKSMDDKTDEIRGRIGIWVQWTVDSKVTEITAPNSLTFNWQGTQDLSSFYKWAEETDFFRELAKIRGEAVFDPNARKERVAKTGQVLGKCAICDRDHVLKNGKMVKHGYHRPGIGYLIGECFGVDYPDIGTSSVAIKHYIPELANFEKRTQRQVKELKKQMAYKDPADITILVPNSLSGKFTPKNERGNSINPNDDHDDWKYGAKNMLYRLDHDLKSVAADIVLFKAKLKNWKPKDL
mgnify:CR=1 FL=1|jgi:hypothetical protein